jgi:thioredoxin 1
MEIRVLDFTAKWCSTCHMIEAMLEKEVIPKYQDKIEFIKVDVEEDEKTTNQYNILSVPTLIILRDNKEVARLSGSISKDKIMQELDGARN